MPSQLDLFPGSPTPPPPSAAPPSRDSTGRLHVVRGLDPLRLLEAAAEQFLRLRTATPDDPFSTPASLLAVRQGGVRDDLIALARARGIPGWFDPPLCLFHELPAWLGGTERRPCEDFERAVLLQRLLRREGGELFGRLARPDDFLRGVDRLFGELCAEGVTPDAFADAVSSRSAADGFERQRDADLARLYRRYRDTLEAPVSLDGREVRFRDGRDALADCAVAVGAEPDRLADRLGGRREVRFYGLSDLRGGWRLLLRALVSSPAVDRVVLYTAQPLDFGAELSATEEVMDEPETVARRLFGPPGRSEETVALVTGPDVERELDEVARRIRSLADGGVPLSRMAVVVRQGRPYLDLALGALRRFGVPATARRRLALREVPVVRAVLTLFEAAASGWTRHGLAELAEQPYLGSDLDARLINLIGYRRRLVGLSDWTAAWESLLEEAEAAAALGEDEAHGRRGPPTPPAAWVRRGGEAFARFVGRADALDGARPLAEWLAWLEAFLADDPWGMVARMHDVPAGRYDVVRIDLAGWRGLREVVRQWRHAVEAWGGGEERLEVSAFTHRLAELLTGDVAFGTPVQRGVHVLEALAASYRTFDHVFLVGLAAGTWPVAAPRSPLLDEAERATLRGAGVPLEARETWDRRERELFRMLVASPRSGLTLSWSRTDPMGREVVRSPYADALADVALMAEEELPTSLVVVPGALVVTGPAAAAAARHGAEVEFARERPEPSPYKGQIEDPALLAWLGQELGEGRLWSPTQLEAYAKCPWAFLSGRLLRLRRSEEPDEEMDAATRGTILHDALHRFYDGAMERIGGPVFLRAADLEWAMPALLDALDAALAGAAGRLWLGHGAFREAKRQELRRLLEGFLAWEVQEHEDMYAPRKRNAPRMVRTGVAQHEVRFEEVVLERGGIRFRFRGQVDRVELGIDERVEAGGLLAAVDYKTTKYGVPGAFDEKQAWEDGVVLQVPLYAYALTQLHPGARAARVEYRAIKDRRSVHALQPWQVDPKISRIVSHADDQAKLERALDAVVAHVHRAASGAFPPEPPPSCGCPRFCHAFDICRISGGPRVLLPR